METTVNNNLLEGQVGEFSFDENKISNKVNGKEYTANGSVAFVEGHNGSGLQINGGQVSIPLADMGISTDTQTISVSYWLKWDGIDNFMPVGFNSYDAWVINGFFGFNTNQGDVYGIKNPYTKGQFTHTVLIFNKGDYTLNSMYINGVKQTLSKTQTADQLKSLTVFENNLNISGFGVNDKYRYNGSVIDDFKVFNRELTDDEVVVLSSAVVLDIEPEKSKIYVNENVTANLVIENIKEIAAEDIRIKYDSSKLQFLGIDEIDGIKLVKKDAKADEFRFILASKGIANVVTDKKILLKLNFKGIAAGDALVDVTKARVSDGIEMEKDLTDDQCGQATITIKELMDVNKNGEFTLLDLAIDGRHFGEDPTTLPEYDTDQVVNGAIDDDDLLKIGEYMLANSNYKFN
ncbi:LamG-like jellyroll fold domain-containing protein [Clostridium saccharoperbutylacetonicum]